MFINYPLGFTFYFAYYSGVLYSDSQLTIQRKATGSRGERKQKLSSVIRNDKKNKHNNIKTLRQKQQNPHLLKKKKKKVERKIQTYPHWYNCRRIWMASSYFLMAKEKFPFLKTWLPDSFNSSA